MPHIRATTAQAYARLTAMKLYAYRALDYVHAASADDRRYLLFCAVQKAKVSTEGVKVMSLLSECIGAKGFESDTYFEMALRDSSSSPAWRAARTSTSALPPSSSRAICGARRKSHGAHLAACGGEFHAEKTRT